MRDIRRENNAILHYNNITKKNKSGKFKKSNHSREGPGRGKRNRCAKCRLANFFPFIQTMRQTAKHFDIATAKESFQSCVVVHIF